MVVALTEIVPAEVRTAGFSLAYALATALFGGFTPLVSTWLIEVTGNRAAPGDSGWRSAAPAVSPRPCWSTASERPGPPTGRPTRPIPAPDPLDDGFGLFRANALYSKPGALVALSVQ